MLFQVKLGYFNLTMTYEHNVNIGNWFILVGH